MLNNICNASWKYQKKIRKSTEFLLQKFGISYFGVQRITTNGRWSLVTNNPVWVEHCANEKFYQHDPTLVHPDYYQAGVSFVSAHPNPDFRNTLLKTAADKFDMDHCLAVIDKNDQYSEFAFFATSCNNTKIISTYVSQFTVLRQFVRYFKSENRRAFLCAENDGIDLLHLKQNAYFDNQHIVDCSSEYVENNAEPMSPNLSLREQQCLNYLLAGKTAKEMAKYLNLSYRTVEEYIANLKEKLGCRHLHDLFVLFKDKL